MKLELKKNTNTSVDIWVNNMLIADKNWEVWYTKNPDDGMTVVLKEPNNGQNTVKFVINKNTKFKEVK